MCMAHHPRLKFFGYPSQNGAWCPTSESLKRANPYQTLKFGIFSSIFHRISCYKQVGQRTLQMATTPERLQTPEGQSRLIKHFEKRQMISVYARYESFLRV